jgi:hypothetical protein
MSSNDFFLYWMNCPKPITMVCSTRYIKTYYLLILLWNFIQMTTFLDCLYVCLFALFLDFWDEAVYHTSTKLYTTTARTKQGAEGDYRGTDGTWWCRSNKEFPFFENYNLVNTGFIWEFGKLFIDTVSYLFREPTSSYIAMSVIFLPQGLKHQHPSFINDVSIWYNSLVQYLKHVYIV